MKSSHAFTLVELLAVTAVIAILAALLLPVLSKATSKARQIVCASNMRQAIMAVALYAHDHADTIPPNEYWTTHRGADGLRHFHLETTYARLLEPYIGNWTRIAKCPGGKDVAAGPVICTTWESLKHAKLLALFVTYYPIEFTDQPLRVKICQVRKPCEALLFTDSFAPWWAAGRVFSPLEVPPAPLDADGTMVNARYGYNSNHAAPTVHSGGGNAALLDSHVTWVSYDRLWHLDEDGEVTHPFWYPE
jgi:prepilin-type N-terminal cleavage/methylation domain-containing protein/prepilin-type processing-associated H-X9-DG protein